MDPIAQYDDLLNAIYQAGDGTRPLGGMLEPIARALGAVAAGFLVYDEAGAHVTHVIVAPPPRVPTGWVYPLGDMNDDPGIRVLTRAPLSEARRFTDVVPRPRLRSAGWFQRQETAFGMGYGIAVDLAVAGLRVRLFAMRAAGAPDFDSGPLDRLGRVGRHIERAFAGAPHRLAPEVAGSDAVALVYRSGSLAQAVRPDQLLEQRLAIRFGLTRTDARVAVLAAEGLARAEVADRLGISLNSLKTHLRRVFHKLEIGRVGELMRIIGAERLSR